MRTGSPVREHDATFEREVIGHRAELYPAALKMTRNPCDAEDLVQETMIRAYAGMRHYTAGTNARAWLYRIMANTFINTCRKRQREPVHVLGTDLDLVQPAGPETGASASAWDATGGPAGRARSAEAEVLSQFAHSEFRDALAELPECFRAVVYLADVEGYSYKDIAGMIGVPIGTVMSRLSRARCRLRALLAAHGPGRTAESVAA